MFTDPARGTVYRERMQRSNRELIDMVRWDLRPATLGLMQRNVRFDTLWSVMRGKSSSRLMRAGERETSHSLFPQICLERPAKGEEILSGNTLKESGIAKQLVPGVCRLIQSNQTVNEQSDRQSLLTIHRSTVH